MRSVSFGKILILESYLYYVYITHLSLNLYYYDYSESNEGIIYFINSDIQQFCYKKNFLLKLD